MKRFLITLIALSLLLSIAALTPAHARNTLSFGSDTPIDISADNIEYLLDKKIYIISGNATIKSHDSTLTADSIRISAEDGKAVAKGNALIVSKDDTLSADEISMDLNTKFGMIVNGRIFVKSENFHITGESLERVGENKYIVRNGTFTTCDGPVPSWKFTASRLEIEIDGYVFAYNPILYVKGVPAFYIPVIVFPIKKTRQSGLLFPTIGYSNDDGTIFKLPYYQVLGDSMDATFALDSRSKRGLGLDTEFRYALSKDSQGEIDYSIMDEYNKSIDRWSFSLKHQERFSDTLEMKADMNTVSDNDYLFDFGNDNASRYAEMIESNLTLTKSFDNADIQVRHTSYQDIIFDSAAGDPSDSSTQLPKITGKVYKTRLFGTPFSLSGGAVYNNYLRKEYEDLEYMKIDPMLSADLKLGRYALFSPYIKLEQASFKLRGAAATYEDDHYSYLFGSTLSSNILRIFDMSDTLKMRHSIYTAIEYEYVPKQSAYPEYFELAEIEMERHEVTLRLINFITTKREAGGESEYRDPLRLELAQPYDLYEAKRDFDLTLPSDERQPFKPLYADLDIKGADWFTLNGKMYHDHYKKDHIQEYNVSMILKDKRGDRFEASHTYLKDFDDYLTTHLTVNLGYGVSVSNTYRYDYLEDKTTEKSFGVALIMQCWGLDMVYTEELVEDSTVTPATSYTDKKVFLYVSLKGVGDTKDFAENR